MRWCKTSEGQKLHRVRMIREAPEEVKEFKYLGSPILAGGEMEVMVIHILNEGGRSCKWRSMVCQFLPNFGWWRLI